MLKGCGIASLGSLRVFTVQRLSHHSVPRSGVFFPTEQAVRAPNSPDQSVSKDDFYPAIGYRRLSSGLVTSNRRLSGVARGDSFFIQEAADRGPWKLGVGKPTVGGFLHQVEWSALINVRKSPTAIPRGIFVGSWSPHNWFHWLVDTLPSVHLSSFLPAAFDDFPLILPSQVRDKKSWLEPLELVRHDREIVFLSAREYSEVRDLVWIDSPTCPGPLPLNQNGSPSFRVHGSALRAYRNHILQQLGLDGPRPAPSRKIFLARKQGGNRPYNQKELIEVALHNGFEPVFLENLDLRESVEVLLDAKKVIGPHGAGWANALFCREGTQAFMWTWADAKNYNWFANVAATQKLDFVTSFEFQRRGGEMWFSPHTLRSVLET